jgi:hypothetical protein
VQWQEVSDWPSSDDVPFELDDLWEEHIDFDERYTAKPGLKVGGWPLCVQSELYWHDGGERLVDVEHVLQIDSEPKIGFEVGFGGVLHVGRRRSTGTWHTTWQSM